MKPLLGGTREAMKEDELIHIIALKDNRIFDLHRQSREIRKALEDIADYQHRWSDSPIREVQKIARQALERSNP